MSYGPINSGYQPRSSQGQNVPGGPTGYDPNWNPGMTSMTQDPSAQNVGSLARGGGSHGYVENLYSRNAWDNPINQIYGGLAGMAPAQTDQSNPLQVYNSRGASMNMDQVKGMAGYGNTGPKNAKDLYDQIGKMSYDQLARTTTNFNSVSMRDRFQGAAQGYSNLYANENYYKGPNISSAITQNRTNQQENGGGINTTTFLDDMDRSGTADANQRAQGQAGFWGGSGMSQEDNSNWLKKSYGTLYQKMNENGLL